MMKTNTTVLYIYMLLLVKDIISTDLNVKRDCLFQNTIELCPSVSLVWAGITVVMK